MKKKLISFYHGLFVFYEKMRFFNNVCKRIDWIIRIILAVVVLKILLKIGKHIEGVLQWEKETKVTKWGKHNFF